MSKKQKHKDEPARIRKRWLEPHEGFHPNTRVRPGKKAYNRNRAKEELRKEVDNEVELGDNVEEQQGRNDAAPDIERGGQQHRTDDQATQA
jgi:hypothetical protein